MKKKLNPYDFMNIQQMRNSQEFTEGQLRSAYSYFRGLANYRIKSLKEHGYSQSKILESVPDKFPALSELKSGDIYYYLRDAAVFVSRKTSTVKGIKEYRAARIRGLQERGYPVNEDNFDEFIDFLRLVKSGLLQQGLTYDEMIAIYRMRRGKSTKRRDKMLSEDFAKYQRIEPRGDIENNRKEADNPDKYRR